MNSSFIFTTSRKACDPSGGNRFFAALFPWKTHGTSKTLLPGLQSGNSRTGQWAILFLRGLWGFNSHNWTGYRVDKQMTERLFWMFILTGQVFICLLVVKAF